MKRIGIAGATGLVGETLLRLVEPEKSGVEEVRLFASERSAGRTVTFRDREVEVLALDPDHFAGCDVAFSCLEADLAEKVVPRLARHCPVIDKSSRFRLEPGVPLVVPEVNPDALARHENIVANPNCTTIPLCVALAPLAREFGLESLHVCTYQSVSGAGRAALEQLRYETEFLALGQEPPVQDSPFPGRIAQNLIPLVGGTDKQGHSAEERKLMDETRKILNLPGLRVNATCVRVPVMVGHSLAIAARFAVPARPKDALKLLRHAPGVSVSPDDEFVTPVEAAGRDEVFVSRVRPGAEPADLNLWVATDNLRKGAALNAIQVAGLL